MVTARIAGLSPGTSPPPVRIPIRPFLVLMRPLCRFLRAYNRKIDGSDWMYKRHRSEPLGKFRPVMLLPNQISQHSLVILHSETIDCTTPAKPEATCEREH